MSGFRHALAATLLATLFSSSRVVAQTSWPEGADPSGLGLDEQTRDAIETAESIGLDVNTAGINELVELPGVSLSDARLLVARRSKAGRFGSILEAAKTPGLSPAAAEALTRFAMGDSRPPSDWMVEARVASTWHSDRLARVAPVNRLPDNALLFKAAWHDSWEAGAALLVLPGLTSIRFGEAAGVKTLIGTGPAINVDPGGFYLAWHNPGISVIAGTFQVGFASGLTMDITGLRRPDGARVSNSFTHSADTGSFGVRNRFSGVAVQFKAPVGSSGHTVNGTVFASYRFADPSRRDVVWDRCANMDIDCGDADMAPYMLFDDEAAAGESTSGVTLTNVLREGTAGASIGFGNDVWRVQAIGWATGLRYRPDAPGIGPSTSSRMPEDRKIFGAAGVAGSAVLPNDGIFITELAVNDVGAVAAVAEASYSPLPGLDIEPSFRWYPTNWDNPWTGSTADASRYRGNRARDETGGRFDLTWRSSAFTRNRLRLDAAWHEQDDTPDSTPHLDIETATGLEVFASSHETLRLEFRYQDRDVTRSGRAFSFEPYHSASTGNLSGGCRMDWAFSVRTKRIPRTAVTARISQGILDSATLQDRFDIDMTATLRVDTELWPGPKLSGWFRWSDESMVADTSPSPGQGCASTRIDGPIPAACRGDSRLDAGIALLQRLAAGKTLILIDASFRYTRHVDDRPSRIQDVDTATGPNEFAATLSLSIGAGGGADRR